MTRIACVDSLVNGKICGEIAILRQVPHSPPPPNGQKEKGTPATPVIFAKHLRPDHRRNERPLPSTSILERQVSADADVSFSE